MSYGSCAGCQSNIIPGNGNIMGRKGFNWIKIIRIIMIGYGDVLGLPQ